MVNLDDIDAIKKLDPAGVLGSIEKLGDQCLQAWSEASQIQFPPGYDRVTAIVFSGMGGSALGAYVVKSLFGDVLSVPFEIVNDYHLPHYVNKNTLVILGSYSGTTEETISCAQEALAKKAKVTGLTTGGKLEEIFKTNRVPAYIFSPKHNPSRQPRLGTGYSIVGQIAIFNTLKLVNVDDAQVSEVAAQLTKGNAAYGVTVPQAQNRAKQLASSWIGKIPIIVAAEFLTQTGRVIRNQIHESAKTFAAYHDIPELNHHLIEGLKNPPTNKDILQFLFLSSPGYSKKIRRRLEITKDVVGKNGIKVHEFIPQGSGRIAQALECIQFGAYVNYYMAISYGVDPSQIPWVDYFKAELAKV